MPFVPERPYQESRLTLLGDLFNGATAFGVRPITTPPSERLTAQANALAAQVIESFPRPLARRFALPLRHGRKDVKNETTSRRSRVDAVGNAEERTPLCEVPIHQLAEVANTARQAVELYDEQSIRVAVVEKREGPLQFRTIHRPGTETRIRHDLDELQIHGVGVGGELLALRVQGNALVRLTLTRHPDVPDDPGFHEYQCISKCDAASPGRSLRRRTPPSPLDALQRPGPVSTPIRGPKRRQNALGTLSWTRQDSPADPSRRPPVVGDVGPFETAAWEGAHDGEWDGTATPRPFATPHACADRAVAHYALTTVVALTLEIDSRRDRSERASSVVASRRD